VSAKILDGKLISKLILQEIIHSINTRKQLGLQPPALAVILVGNDPASAIYVRNKRLACEQVGIISEFFHLGPDTSQNQLLDLIHKLNNNPKIHGILVQLPLPRSIKTQAILDSINIKKDVDGFHPQNMGLLAQGWPILQSCTPLGIMKLLSVTKVHLPGQHAVIVGASNIVGKPIALLLLNAGCTVTICNKNVKNLQSIVSNADILVAATGQPHLIKGAWIKSNSIVIDVGTTKVNNKLTGDVEFEIAKDRAAWITKVPGGVGPMTIAYLLKNTLLAQKLLEN
jgi:methylenetetrahydrofolate dehydrogenase (NADP+) / methenyltetrahydrofolate cyclohydrolase